MFTHHVGIWPLTDWRRAQSKCTSWTMELTERDIYRTPSTPLTRLLHCSCYTSACCTVLLHICLLHRSCYTSWTIELTECYIYSTTSTLLTSLLHRSCYTPESRVSGRLAVLGNVTQNGLLADTTSTCPVVVSHQADVHL